MSPSSPVREAARYRGFTRREGSVLLVLLILAGAVRLPGLFGRSIWYDEALTLTHISGHSSFRRPSEPVAAGELKEVFRGSASPLALARGLRDRSVHPPLYFLLLGTWTRIAGNSLEGVRFFSLFLSLIAAFLLFRILRISVLPGAWAAAIVWTFSYRAVFLGMEARSAALAFVFLLGTALAAAEKALLEKMRGRGRMIAEVVQGRPHHGGVVDDLTEEFDAAELLKRS